MNLKANINDKKELFIELTDKCNLSCSYCNKHFGNNFINLKLFEKIIKQITQDYIDQIDFLCLWGGEPLLHPDFENILIILNKYCKNINKKFKISINTNGILLKSKAVILHGFIEKLQNIDFIIYVSLDGLGKSGNINRGINDIQYNMVIDSIEYISNNFQLANFELNISSVLVLNSSKLEDLISFITYFESKGIKINFCFQEIMGGIDFNINSKEVFINLLKRFLYLNKKGYKSVIESNKDINSTIRINEKGDAYNFIDESFNGSEDFLISRNGDLSFLNKIDWYKNVSNKDIWDIIYINKSYISLVEKIYNS